MRPQDIAVLLKIVCYGHEKWFSKDVARDLFISPAEVSNSLERSTLSGLIAADKQRVNTQALLDFLVYGLPYVFPQHTEGISRGVPTAHSHPEMHNRFVTDMQYVWPDADSNEKGFAVQPLYAGAVNAAKHDEQMYLMLALTDMLRMGRPREKKAAIARLEQLMRA